MEVKCAIIDDDKVFMQIMEKYISNDSKLELTNKFYDVDKLLDEEFLNDVDLIFLDVLLPSMNGIDFISTLSNKPELVLMSTSKEFGPEAFTYNAIDYLHKPVTKERFDQCLSRIHKHFSIENKPHKHDSFFVKHDRVWKRIRFDDIIIIKADNNNVVLITADQRISLNMSFKEALALLPEDKFMRVHRSFIVNLEKVDLVDYNVINVRGKTVPVSATYLNTLYERLHLHK